MRRNDREITEGPVIDQVIRSCDCCRLGFPEGGGSYIVPLNFGFTMEEGRRVLYFHGAKEGKKIRLIRELPHVGFEMDTNHKVNEAETACGYSFRFQSIIGQGHVCLVENLDEKRKALQIIMEHYSSKRDWQFPEAAVEQTAVIKLVVTELACKEHL
ncbi:MAG: pyridoxamine 5'-phosphate oxidase family protein [Clostridium sp.]|nr:pyridoxamine 5'-phosphate oxidase family protein [Clostridium sp.]